MPNRADKLWNLMRQSGFEAAWIVKRENIRYLTGYTGEGSLLVAKGTSTILTDFRYIEQAARESPECRVLQTTGALKQWDLLGELLGGHGLDSLAFEPDEVCVSDYDVARVELPGIEFVPLCGLPEKLRAVKDQAEIDCVIAAAAIACKAFEQTLPRIVPGMTEREVQLELDYAMLRLGSEQVAFQTIACAGPNGSLPHATPSTRPIQKGELLTLDFGAQVDGYKCDMTRTIAIGQISGELRAIYDAVREAQSLAFEAIAPGVSCKQVDKIARDYLEAIYPGAFGHSLGHGVGLCIHENPSFSMRSDDLLAPGHVMTVEPGVYIPGLGGCRTEDMAIITEAGYLNPITVTRDLIIV